MTEQDYMQLLQLFDGELKGEAADALKARIAAEEELATEWAILEAGQAMLKTHIESQAEAVDFDGFAEGVMARIDAEGIVPNPEPAPARAVAEPTRSLGERVKAWWAQYWTPVVVSAAAAAAVAFLVSRPDSPSAPAEPGEATVATGPVTVESVENEGNKTVLISQPVEAEGATVIWLLDDEEADDEASPMGEDPI